MSVHNVRNIFNFTKSQAPSHKPQVSERYCFFPWNLGLGILGLGLYSLALPSWNLELGIWDLELYSMNLTFPPEAE